MTDVFPEAGGEPTGQGLEVLGVAKRYRRRPVLESVSLRVDAGEVVGLLGPNGAGKTTCFYMVLGLLPCDRGSIRLDGRDLTRLPVHRRAALGLGYLPQESSVFRKLSVADNILAILETRPGLDRAARRRRLEQLLEDLNIGHLRAQVGISLSGGERRRVEIARALASEPRYMLLDEPFAGVDPISVVDIQRIVSHLRERGIGVLITDHNVREALGICQRAYILSEGRVIATGSPGEVMSDPQVRRCYLGEDFNL